MEPKAAFQFTARQRLILQQGDITQDRVDAIVNAANAHLQHGGGVAAAISRAAGWQLQQESDRWVNEHGPATHDRPAVTGPGRLPCRYVIHAVGPVWGAGDEDHKLAAAIRGSLEQAEALGLESIAFPAISTGIFGFPKARAAAIFFRTICAYFRARPDTPLAEVRITLFDQPTLHAFLTEFTAWQSGEGCPTP
ncbi:MAG: macro domain-containing protein [Chloroflexi bacterium]|jgi:O-acetyl-ADP-ribose deacetylase (regulator of RNase III)|nr:macro domain-containing protein [Anaerolineaceae bacterium]NMB89119.1 macro domain-containing protein [Chloroflexota bacterium]